MVRDRKYKRLRARDGEDMGTTGLPRNRGQSFVMTLWLEPTEGQEQTEWRWRVLEAPTGERRYFRRLADVLAYVSERAGAPPPC